MKKNKTNQSNYHEGDYIVADIETAHVVYSAHTSEEIEAYLESFYDEHSYVIYLLKDGKWNYYGAKIHVCHITTAVEED